MRKIKKTIAALTCFGLAFAGAGVCNVATTQTASADTTATFECAGAGIRLDYNKEDGIQTGIRFRVKIDNATLEAAGAENIKILVMPTDLLGDGVLDVNDTDAREETLDDWQDFVNNDGTIDSNYKQAYAYAYGMTEAEWNRPTAWRAYYLDENGEPVYTSNQLDRSLSEVALSLENDATETPERKAMADDYILEYTYTYDHGVRDTNGKWKTDTYEFRYGTELSVVEAALPKPTTETREDFSFLDWKMTKGADKVKVKEGKTILTGNVTEEAYWLLTGEISLDSPEKVAEYADLTQKMTKTEVIENSTGDGVAFKSGTEASTNIEYAHINWKNIVVNTNLNCRFKGFVTSAKRESDQAMGRTKIYFGDQTTPIINVQNEAFDEFVTQDVSTFTGYGSENGYCELADVSLMGGNAVHVFQTATFEKFQIGATQSLVGKTGNQTADSNWKWIGGNSPYNVKSTHESTKILASESYLSCSTTQTANGGVPVIGIYTGKLNAGDIIELTIKSDERFEITTGNSTKFDAGGIEAGLAYASWVNATTGFETITVKVASGNPQWLIIGGSSQKVANFVIENIKVIRAS